MSVEYFQANSSVPFPRCTEAKFAGNDDRLQIIDVSRKSSMKNNFFSFPYRVIKMVQY